MRAIARNSRARGRVSGKLVASVAAQAIAAATSLALQVIAARSLGLAEFGAFAVLLGLLVSASALFIGYVGDGMAVLDRHQPEIRSALVSSALLIFAGCAAVAVGAVLVLRRAEFWLAVVYAAMVVAWLVRESVRRLLMARLEFGRLVVNDAVYLVAALGTVGGFAAAGTVSLFALFSAMALGSLVALAVGVLCLPSSELARLRPGLAGMRELAAFGVWRAAQAMLRPVALLLARVLVGATLSLAAVGVLEAGRLVVAPLQVVINGVGGFLLAAFAARERAGAGGSGRLADRAGVLLLCGTVLGGLGFGLLAGPLGVLMTGGPVDVVLVIGWVLYLGTWAVGLPYVSECVARRHSRAVFVTRLVDSLVGLGLAAVVLLGGGPVVLVPFALAVGGAYSVLRLRVLAVRGRAVDAAGDH